MLSGSPLQCTTNKRWAASSARRWDDIWSYHKVGPFSTDWEKSHGTSQAGACTADFSQPRRRTFPFYFPVRNGNSSNRSRTALFIYSLAEKQDDAHHHPVQAWLKAPSTPTIGEDAEQPQDSLGIPNYTSVVHGLPIPGPTSQSLCTPTAEHGLLLTTTVMTNPKLTKAPNSQVHK